MSSMEEMLARWGITPEEAERAGLYGVDDASTVHQSYPREPAIVIPYYTLTGESLIINNEPFNRIRRLNVPAVAEGFRAQKIAKYLQPPNTGVQIYFPRVGGDWQAVARDPAIPVTITEGEAKAIVGCLRFMPTIALGGVFSFMDAVGRLHPSIAAFTWESRDTSVIYDSDAAYNSQVSAAESRLAQELFYKLRAKMKIVRLPSRDNQKVGLDDYIRLFGVEALRSLVRATDSLLSADGRVIALNENLVWVEAEGLVYDFTSQLWLRKESLVSGSKYSAEVIVSASATDRTPKRKSIAKMWLTHPLARRVDEALFRPGDPPNLIGNNGRMAMNLWSPVEISRGPVEPFVELSNYLFSNLPPDVQDLPMKLLAYKTQNLQEKPPLALVLIGPQGAGKSLWAEIVRDAFKPYSTNINPKTLESEFQGWLERSIMGVVQEMSPEDLKHGRERLKSLISDKEQPMNEKYRPVRQVESYTFYIITSNQPGAGAFDYDDRRMIVINCPPPREREFYDRIKIWKESGGAKNVYGYLMDFPLSDWRPPARAPMTQEKYMAYVESLSPVQRLAEDMRNTMSPTVVKAWLDKAIVWAENMELSANAKLSAMARVVLSSIRDFQIRPWYTAEELTTMFPYISIQFMGADSGNPSPGRMSRELRTNGISYLTNSTDPRGFLYRGRLVQYLVVAQFDRWRAPISQAEFDEYMRSWPTYGQLTRAERRA